MSGCRPEFESSFHGRVTKCRTDKVSIVESGRQPSGHQIVLGCRSPHHYEFCELTRLFPSLDMGSLRRRLTHHAVTLRCYLLGFLRFGSIDSARFWTAATRNAHSFKNIAGIGTGFDSHRLLHKLDDSVDLTRLRYLNPTEKMACFARLLDGTRLTERMAGTTRLELATSAVTGQRSNQLNYVPQPWNQQLSVRPCK